MPQSELIETLKQQARDQAGRNGHDLGIFQSARSDPDRYVAFCSHCRHMVIIDAAPASGSRSIRLFGYALQAGCHRQVA